MLAAWRVRDRAVEAELHGSPRPRWGLQAPHCSIRGPAPRRPAGCPESRVRVRRPEDRSAMTRMPAQPDPRATARVPVVIGHVPRPHPAPGGPIPSDRTRLPGLRTQRRARAAGVRYTFDHLTEIVDRFLELQRVVDYSLYLQDYGGPIGFRLALAHPERVQALVIQN